MLFELLKKVSEVEITDKKTKEKKVVKVVDFYLHSEDLEKDLRIEPHKVVLKDGNTTSNKDILSVLATNIK